MFYYTQYMICKITSLLRKFEPKCPNWLPKVALDDHNLLILIHRVNPYTPKVLVFSLSSKVKSCISNCFLTVNNWISLRFWSMNVYNRILHKKKHSMIFCRTQTFLWFYDSMFSNKMYVHNRIRIIKKRILYASNSKLYVWQVNAQIGSQK